MTAQYENMGRTARRLERFDEVDAVHHRHTYIRDEEGWLLLLYKSQRLLAIPRVAGNDKAHLLPWKHLLQVGSYEEIIIRNHDLFHQKSSCSR